MASEDCSPSAATTAAPIRTWPEGPPDSTVVTGKLGGSSPAGVPGPFAQRLFARRVSCTPSPEVLLLPDGPSTSCSGRRRVLCNSVAPPLDVGQPGLCPKAPRNWHDEDVAGRERMQALTRSVVCASDGGPPSGCTSAGLGARMCGISPIDRICFTAVLGKELQADPLPGDGLRMADPVTSYLHHVTAAFLSTGEG